MSLSAKKKRRRRKQSSPSNPKEEAVETPSVQPPVSGGAEELPDLEDNAAASDELPDFDLASEDAEEAETPKPRVKVNPEEITANMMARGMSSNKSLDELISDRSIESRFEFEEKGDSSIPDFVDLAQASSTTPTYSPDSPSSAGGGKKKQRQAERVARAIAAKEAEEEEKSILEKYFPQLLNEKGNFSAIKLTEQGAWVGIFALVAWEVYINSPLFERAAPLAPVVFELVTKSY